ncbi:YhcN/YlaJ family sporulation lipoprotein [Ammoniphilus sp. YIM 78166]|uniref:YhcN/YlaJ family sporulation lipoprotein n=1 Tax=Ammoniphilus sp. YIM 78166 TaxID=1644106 RepID=UPI00106FAD42|nr:YhcN/YlaJ family sporulation lipoprotein [Ammoniphilus sp. YIM 78166]
MRKLLAVKLTLLVSLASVSLAGCGMGARTQQQQQGVQTNQMTVASAAANQITNMAEVRAANVIVTNRNAYVAASLMNNAEGALTREIESRIANQVKMTDPTIQNVYVSTNPDFVNRMRGYSTHLQQGRPVAGIFTEFNEMIRRIFPNAR